MLGHLTGSPRIMLEKYRLKGLQKCFVEGKLRWNNGKIEEGRWLIIGTEGSGLALQEDKEGKVIRVPDQGYFIRARLKPTEERWEAVKLKGRGVSRQAAPEGVTVKSSYEKEQEAAMFLPLSSLHSALILFLAC